MTFAVEWRRCESCTPSLPTAEITMLMAGRLVIPRTQKNYRLLIFELNIVQSIYNHK